MDHDQEMQITKNENSEFSIKMKSSHVNKIFLLVSILFSPFYHIFPIGIIDKFSFIVFSNFLHVFVMQNLPANFCKSYMPDNNNDVILVDDKGQETITKYLAKGHRLSGGWKRFATDHKLSEEDILVFRIIATAPYRLQVIPLCVLCVRMMDILTI